MQKIALFVFVLVHTSDVFSKPDSFFMKNFTDSVVNVHINMNVIMDRAK